VAGNWGFQLNKCRSELDPDPDFVVFGEVESDRFPVMVLGIDNPSFSCAGLVVGTSGSPWISGSTVTGVIGGLQEGGCTPSVSYSAPFNERTAVLLARAEAGGRSQGPPFAFLGSC
jgi:hypothetical protein